MATSFTAVLYVFAAIAVRASDSAATVSCSHSVNQAEIVPRLPLEPSLRGRREVAEPIRFQVYYDSTVASLPAAKRTVIQSTTVPNVLAFLQDTLAVRPDSVVAKILLERQCTTSSFFIDPDTDRRKCVASCEAQTMCGTVVVPEDHLFQCIECGDTGSSLDCVADSSTSTGPGVTDKDYILYVSADQNECPGASTLAFAGPCQMEGMLDRPVAGFVNFCPSAFDSDPDPDFLLSVTKHEVLHAVGFSRALFPFWRRPDGTPRTDRDSNGFPPISNGVYQWSDSTIRSQNLQWLTRTRTVSHTVNLMVTERVVEEGRTHFGCPTLEGVELENQGGDATELSHWEKRILGNEAMTGVFTYNPGFSRMTLAALEDSGWYVVTYDQAVPLAWGKNAGCDFVQGSCGAHIAQQITSGVRLNPFCNVVRDNSNQQRSCTADRSGVAICNLQDSAGTAGFTAEYQYFPDASLGGALSVADFCPFQNVFDENVGGETLGSDCSDPDNLRSSNVFAETYGPGSRCLEHGRAWTATFPGFLPSTPDVYGGGCYQYSCSSSGVTVTILGEVMNCTCEGRELDFDFTTAGGTRYQGSILCPSCEDICYDDLESCPPSPPPPCYNITGTMQPPTTDSAHYLLPYCALLVTALVVAVAALVN